MRVLSAVVLAASVCAASVSAAQTPAGEAPVYHASPVASLALEDGLPTPSNSGWWNTRRPHAYAVLDGPGEAWLASRTGFDDRHGGGHGTLAVAVPWKRDVTGRLFLEDEEGRLVPVRFRVPADAFSSDARTQALTVARDEALALLNGGWPGAAWWRHRVAALEQELGLGPDSRPPAPRRNRAVPGNMDDTYALFTGGRAVAENLQLDRILPASPDDDGEATRAIDDVPGITVAAYDWTAAIEGLAPALDPLAEAIPEDQHALFFPSFEAMVALADRADEQGTPVLAALSDPTGEADTKGRTQRQLGLPLSELARLLGPKVIESVAITGGDPYLRSGSDVALLFRARDRDVLHALVLARVAAAVAGEPGVVTGEGTVDNLGYVAHRTPDRAVCSYVARIGEVVIVTNSEAQLRRLVAVAEGAPSLAALPEYGFFRDRYRRGDPAETALLVVSDATIRRWCGPRWRIGSSRRTRAEAALAEVRARLIDRGEAGPAVTAGAAGAAGAADAPATGGPKEGASLAGAPDGIGEVTLAAGAPRSSVYGTLGFLTPIAELDLDRVTQAEVDVYGRWRDGYQQNWSGVFDPIAVRLGVQPHGVSLDVTVRPLIAGSDYREFIELTGDSSIGPGEGDPHDGALLHWAVAVDKRAGLLAESTSMLKLLMPQAEPLGWLGPSVAMYVDDGPFWDELLDAEDPQAWFEDAWVDMPVALHAEVGDPLLLTAFLVALRAMGEQAAPGMSVWENGTHAEQPFVTIRPSESAVADADAPEGLVLRYAASGDGLLVTLSRTLLEDALDRRAAVRAAEQAAAPADDAPAGGAVADGAAADGAAAGGAPAGGTTADGAGAPEWLGRHVSVAVDGRLLRIAERFARADDSLGGSLRADCYANLPILNAWRRMLPDEDPVALHERLWNRRLLCPGGGAYAWNDAWQTMESTVYGHPGEPRPGPALPPALLAIARAAAGLTFEEDGLRARAEIRFER
jgi:hypothetical protein